MAVSGEFRAGDWNHVMGNSVNRVSTEYNEMSYFPCSHVKREATCQSA
jgi:hypothetical protein